MRDQQRFVHHHPGPTVAPSVAGSERAAPSPGIRFQAARAGRASRRRRARHALRCSLPPAERTASNSPHQPIPTPVPDGANVATTFEMISFDHHQYSSASGPTHDLKHHRRSCLSARDLHGKRVTRAEVACALRVAGRRAQPRGIRARRRARPGHRAPVDASANHARPARPPCSGLMRPLPTLA